jgi:methyl-accepting chemotaxis protein
MNLSGFSKKILQLSFGKSLVSSVKWTLRAKGVAVGIIAMVCTVLFCWYVYVTIDRLNEHSVNYRSLSTEHEHLSNISAQALQCGQAIRNIYIDPKDSIAVVNLKTSRDRLLEIKEAIIAEYPQEYKKFADEFEAYIKNTSLIVDEYESKGSISRPSVTTNTQVWRDLKDIVNIEIKSINSIRGGLNDRLLGFLEDANRAIFSFGLITVIITFVALFGFYFSIMVSVKKLKVGLLDFFEYLHRRQKSVASIALTSEDEFAEMAAMINENISAIQTGIKKDARLISEVSEVAMKVKNGFYSYKVTATADNEMLEELKDKFNEMIETTNSNIQKLITALSHYGNSDFTYHINTKDISGNFGSLVEETNELGTTVSELIAIITTSGEKLQSSTKRLALSAETLSSSSSEQAASLEETASAIEEITSTIRNTAEQADIMATLAVDANKSAKEGDLLAKATKEAMEEIARATDAINEAVTIVDKIAFQTNILSLNATVEAARAGDAGRGFAAVASEVRNLASRSSDAVKKITELVTVARTKANEGRQIANTMKEGFENLSQKTSKTSEIVEFVAIANKEQMAGIEQINDSLIHLDRMTQESSRIASDTSVMSKDVRELSQYLMKTASRTKFKEEAKEQIGSVDLVFDLARVKQLVIGFKEECFEKISKNEFENIDRAQTQIGKWMQANEKEAFAKSKAFANFCELFDSMLIIMAAFADESTKERSSFEIIQALGADIEIKTSQMFFALDEIKRG